MDQRGRQESLVSISCSIDIQELPNYPSTVNQEAIFIYFVTYEIVALDIVMWPQIVKVVRFCYSVFVNLTVCYYAAST